MGRMLNWWGDVTVIGGMFPLIVADIPSTPEAGGCGLFPKTREARFGKPLEEVVAGPRQGRSKAFASRSTRCG